MLRHIWKIEAALSCHAVSIQAPTPSRISREPRPRVGKIARRHSDPGQVRARHEPRIVALPFNDRIIMTLSMHAASVPVFHQLLAGLSDILVKAEAHATEKKIEPAALLQARLYPDMFA